MPLSVPSQTASCPGVTLLASMQRRSTRASRTVIPNLRNRRSSDVAAECTSETVGTSADPCAIRDFAIVWTGRQVRSAQKHSRPGGWVLFWRACLRSGLGRIVPSNQECRVVACKTNLAVLLDFLPRLTAQRVFQSKLSPGVSCLRPALEVAAEFDGFCSWRHVVRTAKVEK